MSELPKLVVPDSLNYIACFLTLECNLNCSYCINDAEQRGDRRKVFSIEADKPRTELTPDEWVRALRRLPVKADLPVTFQGGEPTVYWKGLGLGSILTGIDSKADLLTNLVVRPQGFSSRLRGQIGKFKRDLPYPAIRVSYHEKEMKRIWGEKAFEELVRHCVELGNLGLTVDPDFRKSDVGIYMVDHPENHVTEEMKATAAGKVPLMVKDFLGVHEGELYGQYAYPYSTDLIARNLHPKTLSCECHTTELLIDPLGFVWRCHLYLYKAWEKRTPISLFATLEERQFDFSGLGAEGNFHPVGHMLDQAFTMDDVFRFRPCDQYGACVGCDTKFKKDRFGTENAYRTSVVIQKIDWPASLRAKSVLLRAS